MTRLEEDDEPLAAMKRDLGELGLAYADLTLIHRPPPSGAGEALWRGLMRAREDGLVRDFGVSNYLRGWSTSWRPPPARCLWSSRKGRCGAGWRGARDGEIFPGLAPTQGEHVIKKHRYSAFFATDLDLILREWGIETVIVTGTTTENCCHATARDAMFRNYEVAFVSDCTGSFNYPDVGQGAMSAEDVHQATHSRSSPSRRHT